MSKRKTKRKTGPAAPGEVGEYDAFETMIRKVVRVPKTEIDRKHRRDRARRRKATKP